ncbi:non-ribosomal peptide synthetase, partial [Massilia aurea]|uniref:non-ribosomal peptide synthetase n=1 Tax=Massilia aurea TaxID=373040 RepID=UPI0031DCD853
ERVGRNDHFFELGGHSLLVITMTERLHKKGILASVRVVFGAPRLAALAAACNFSTSPDCATVPANLLADHSGPMTPELLSLVKLTQTEIDRIAATVLGGAANIQDIYPLGPLQEGVLFHSLLKDARDPYVQCSTIRFDSRAHLDRFLIALQAVVDRHEILRSSIHWDALVRPVQVVHRRAPLDVRQVELDGAFCPQEQLRELSPQRLNLNRAPLLVPCIAVDPKSSAWYMALLSHHIVCDHMSLELLTSEVRLILQDRRAELSPALPYRNFIAQLSATSQSLHEDYFRTQLGDVDEPSAPFGIFNVQGNGTDVQEARLTVDPKISQRVRQAARRYGTNGAALFHLAWAQVLGKCCARDDVVFGTLLVGRMYGGNDASRVPGMFINTLPIRLRIGELSVSEALKSTFAKLTDLIDHEQAPLALVQRCSSVSPPLPLFTTLLNFRHSKRSHALQDNAYLEGITLLEGVERSNYPITISVDDWSDGFSITAQCTAGIDAERVANYLNTSVVALTDALEQQPDRPIGELQILPEAERHQLLAASNGTAAEQLPSHLINQLFEEQAARQPDATAVVFEDQHLSYGELNRRANRLAHRLIAQGVVPDARVAICVERSLDMIVGLLAILKAGGAYVPLDPIYAGERMAYMLADSQPAVLLTQNALRDHLNCGPDLPVLFLDSPETDDWPDQDPVVPSLQTHHLAYVIYTSGSTGKPKGVMVEHAQVTQLLAATRDKFSFGAQDIWTLFHSFAFDFSVWEIFGALLHGGRLVVVPILCAQSARNFHALLCRERVTVLNQTPTAFRHLIAADAQSDQSHCLRCVIFGGEALELHMLAPWIARHDLQRTLLVNMYGATETTVVVTESKYVNGSELASGAIPIGQPFPHTHIYILDPYGQLMPIGVAGEIHIGGVQVARGYLNRPELTAERFVADPFSTKPGARMYKTGDLGRWLADGNIEYLGRN